MTTGMCRLGPHELKRLDGFLDELVRNVVVATDPEYWTVWLALREELVLSASPDLSAAFAAGFERLTEWRALWKGRSLPAIRPGAPLSEADPEDIRARVTGLDGDVFLAGLVGELAPAPGRDFVKHVKARRAEAEEAYQKLVGVGEPSAEAVSV